MMAVLTALGSQTTRWLTMEDEKIQHMIEAMSCKHFQKDDEREEFENEMWEYTTRLMKMFRDFIESEQISYRPDEVRHG